MIRGIGIDSIEIDRFSKWHSFADKQLKKIFSDDEIAFCRQLPIKAAERFAVRFAAREAFFKALSEMNLKEYIPFLTVCKLVLVDRNDQGVCSLNVRWEQILKQDAVTNIKVHLSMTHDRNRAVAFVVIEEM